QDGTSPSGKIPDGIFLQSGLAVFALRAEVLFARKQKHRSAFRSPAHAKQFACCLVIKKPRHKRGFLKEPRRDLSFR
ncbi:hypothetical protein, partial [Candidatus Avelusimicrobium facis]|uniref:hypothetical protein n=1 Tax=Candidatus Avelusimicrobium facis TaxID=3416203 RepID=UPI003D0B9F48